LKPKKAFNLNNLNELKYANSQKLINNSDAHINNLNHNNSLNSISSNKCINNDNVPNPIQVNINTKIIPVNSTLIEEGEIEMSKDTTCDSHISSHHNFKNKHKATDNYNSHFDIDENSKEYN